jgi:general stress protein 26
MASTKAQESSPSFEEKLTALNGFLDKHKFVLLTSRAPDGSLHARTMAIADKTKDMRVRFIYDRDSYKETEIDNEWVLHCCADFPLTISAHVNVAVDASEKNDGWVSIAGKAK